MRIRYEEPTADYTKNNLPSFGEIIRRKRKEKKISQSEMAEMMNERGYPLNQGSYSKWEKDQARPNVMQFFTLCELLGISDISREFHVTGWENSFSKLSQEGMDKVYEYADLLVRSGLYCSESKSNC